MSKNENEQSKKLNNSGDNKSNTKRIKYEVAQELGISQRESKNKSSRKQK